MRGKPSPAAAAIRPNFVPEKPVYPGCTPCGEEYFHTRKRLGAEYLDLTAKHFSKLNRLDTFFQPRESIEKTRHNYVRGVFSCLWGETDTNTLSLRTHRNHHASLCANLYVYMEHAAGHKLLGNQS